MSKVHYFQRYSQKENVVTNNTLLLLSRLYNHSPQRFQAFFESLLSEDGINIEVGPSFSQQVKAKAQGSIPDGSISQSSFKILIETKLYSNFSDEQLISHASGFADENIKILLLINPEDPKKGYIKKMRKSIHERYPDVGFTVITFDSLITCLDSVISDYETQLKELVNDFVEFAQESDLLPQHKYYMRAIVAGTSFQENIKYNIYYDPKERGFSPHAFIGLYADKAVRAIGRLSKIVTANYDNSTDRLCDINVEKGGALSAGEEKSIISIMHSAQDAHEWDIYNDHRFFLVNEFYETYFPKITKYPIQHAKFFNLKNILNIEELPETSDIANMLEGEDYYWE